MTVVVGYESALEYWRTVGPAFLGNPRRRRSASAAAERIFQSDEKPVLGEGNRRPAGCRLPLQAMVGSVAQRTRSASIRTHMHTGALPPSAFVSAGREFLIASPELCFLQLASSLPFEKLIAIGFELCGTYSLLPDGDMTSRDMPLTSASKLRAFLGFCQGVRGKRVALRAVRYLIDGSASPRETDLAMMLSLPYALGGYGIERPRLNFRVDVPATLANRADRSYCLCDLCWPETKLCLEYDSAKYHLDPGRQESDARRRNTLGSLGYTVMTVSPHQLSDPGAFNRMAHQVADHVGKRLRYVDPGFTRKHLALRNLLLA